MMRSRLPISPTSHPRRRIPDPVPKALHTSKDPFRSELALKRIMPDRKLQDELWGARRLQKPRATTPPRRKARNAPEYKYTKPRLRSRSLPTINPRPGRRTSVFLQVICRPMPRTPTVCETWLLRIPSGGDHDFQMRARRAQDQISIVSQVASHYP